MAIWNRCVINTCAEGYNDLNQMTLQNKLWRNYKMDNVMTLQNRCPHILDDNITQMTLGNRWQQETDVKTEQMTTQNR
jgi:hypothetical protein